jgi:FHS family L-fucose permease-like MFS transporter
LHVYRVHEASDIKGPYLGIAITLFLLGWFIALQKLPHARISTSLNSLPSSALALWRHRHLSFGVVAMFLYCGAEITIGSFLVNYLSRPEIGALSPQHAATYVSIYWGGSMIGRFIGSALLRRISTGTLLGFNASVAACLVTASIASTGHVAMWSILLVGAFNSIMFPSLFTLGIKEMGDLTGKASGVMMSAAVGAAVIPVLQGTLADQIGIHYSFLVPAVCYLYIVFYGLEGCKPRQIQPIEIVAI